MYATKYDKLTKHAKAAGDHNMCSVLAVALTCKTSYAASERLHSFGGRRKRQGTYWITTCEAIEKLGFKMTAVHHQHRNEHGPALTINNVAAKLQRGYYLVLVDRHVLAVHNGTVHDWSKGSKRRVKGIWKIERIKK